VIHKFLEPGDWFAPKRYGYGATLPIAWQGWALSLAYGLAVTGLALGLVHGAAPRKALAIIGILALTGLFLLIVKRRTRGGWRWRWGERD